MVDLIERLSRYRPRDEWGDPTHHSICDEAAAEIERLRRDLDELRAMSADKATAWDALNASHQRGRRKAFEEAAEIAEHAVWGWRGRNIAAALRSRAEEDGR